MGIKADRAATLLIASALVACGAKKKSAKVSDDTDNSVPAMAGGGGGGVEPSTLLHSLPVWRADGFLTLVHGSPADATEAWTVIRGPSEEAAEVETQAPGIQ
jgi:hypothetical protein